jgi:adenosine deaminase
VETVRDLVNRLPKAELHIHIEGTLEPEMAFQLANRNGVDLPFGDIRELRAAYDFDDLQSFLDLYYATAQVLRTPEDFYDLMTAYLDRAAADGVRRAEIFFDPQTHTERGVGFETFMKGFTEAIVDAERRHEDLSADLILCFLRHLSGDDAVATLRDAEPHLDRVIAVGLDSSEVGNPPELFENAFAAARQLGLHAVAHAGEEGPPAYISGALDTLGVERIDHGVRCIEDPDLVSRLASERVPLTVCPFSNVALEVVDALEAHPLPVMVEAGLMVTINSDDPAYFGGYVGDNYVGVAEALGLDEKGLAELARNSISASFLDDHQKTRLIAETSLDLETGHV